MNPKNFRISLLSWLHYLGLAGDGIFYFIAIFVGAMAGLAAVAFHLSLGWAHELLFGSYDLTAITRPWLLIPLIPAGGALLSAIFLTYLVPEARGSGIPEAKISYVAHSGHIPMRVTLGKFLIGVLNIGSGSSLGREGPTVQFCSGLASWVGETFCLRKDRIQSLVPIGAAAGLAAAFNTPIAAVTFTLEEIVGDLNARVMGAIVFASISASVVERAVLGNEPIFKVPAYGLRHPAELLIYAFVGVVCAVVGLAFVRGLLFVRSKWIILAGWKSIAITAVGGLGVGIIGIWFPQVFAVGYPFVSKALSNEYSLIILLALLIFKLVATIVSYGTGSSGGIFAPSLFLGAMAGGAVATVADLLFPGFIFNPGSYALVGMGAAFAAIVRVPMTSVLIIFELTQDYNIILALMVANAISFGLSKIWQPTPIYSALSLQNGVALPDHESEHLLHEIHVSDAMVRDVLSLPANITVEEAVHRTKELPFSGYPVLDARGRLAGIVSRYDFNQALADGKEKAPILDITTKTYILHAHPDQSLDSVMGKLGSRRISRLPVVSREDPSRLIGIITAEDVMAAFGKAMRGAQSKADAINVVPVLATEEAADPPAAGTDGAGARKTPKEGKP